MKKSCLVCGKPGYQYYSYCFEHLPKKSNSENVAPKESKKIEQIQPEPKKENTCKKCGQPSGKYDVCYDCFRKKSDEDLKRDIETLIESEKDSGVDIRDKWPAKIRTKNGVKVRSHAECRIADWLSNHSLIYEYENMVPSKNDINKFLLSDFYIPQANIYIEYWGYKDKETYNKRRNEKMIIYNERNFIVKDLEDRNLEVLDDAMKILLMPYLPDDLKAKLN